MAKTSKNSFFGINPTSGSFHHFTMILVNKFYRV
jgi:hypothetical protein